MKDKIILGLLLFLLTPATMYIKFIGFMVSILTNGRITIDTVNEVREYDDS